MPPAENSTVGTAPIYGPIRGSLDAKKASSPIVVADGHPDDEVPAEKTVSRVSDGNITTTGPISSATPQRPPARSLVLEKSRSYGDGHGFTCFGREDCEADGQGEEANAFEVKWEGDDDPMSPRNMRRGKKWLVVLIVSAGSTCV